MKTKIQAFTLIEVIVVIGLFVGITIVYTPFMIKELQSKQLDECANEVTQNISMTQQKSSGRLNNKSYGIKFFFDNYVYFVGNSYEGRESEEIFNLPRNKYLDTSEMQSGNEIIFITGSFQPNNYGKIRILEENKYIDIIINSEGLIYVEK